LKKWKTEAGIAAKGKCGHFVLENRLKNAKNNAMIFTSLESIGIDSV